MRTHKRKRFISLLLALCMVVSMLPVTALAQELEDPAPAAEQTPGCTHHTEHTPECGYAEAVAPSVCTHQCGEESGCVLASCAHTEHDEACGYAAATDEIPCTHQHDENCGYAAPSEGTSCNHTEHDETCGYAAATDETPCAHQHDENCGYAAPSEETPCDHTHDEVCGYAEATAETPCTHQCGEDADCVTAVCAHEGHDDVCGYSEGSEAQPCAFVCAECTQNILYSDSVLTFSQESGPYLETDGARSITLIRSGDIASEMSATILVYDNSANYGQDYQIWYNGSLAAKNEDAVSIYDVFRDQGELTSGMLFDLSATLEQVESLQSGEAQEDVSAAEMLAQLDDLGVQAAAIPVAFEAGQSELSLAIDILDDSASEYEETFFLAVLDAEGEVVETAQLVCAIADDEEAPGVEVSFDCEAELTLDPESGEAELVFLRRGDLATTTMTALCLDGEPLGWIDFTPWQEVQTTWVIEPGVYTLLDENGEAIAGQQVTVLDTAPAEMTVPEGADPVLDAVPEEYAAMPSMVRAISTSFLPTWATGGSYSNENEIVVMGSTSNNLFNKGGNTSKGSASFFVDGYNVHELDTGGFGSVWSTGYLFLDSKSTYDFTGVESITSKVRVAGVNGDAEICIGVASTGRYTESISSAGNYELTYTLPDKFQGTKYVYYGNTDPDKGSDGTNMYVPNGFKLNLRQYRFVIEDSSAYVDELTYNTGGNTTFSYVPDVPSNKRIQTMTINSKTYGANKTVDIVYSCDSQYPARLKGFLLRNYVTGDITEEIPLSDNGDGTAGTASFTFDAAFLKQYESTYCVETSVDGVSAWTFHVIPVYEKIPVSLTILPAEEGTIQQVDSATLYRGDSVEFEDTATDSTLSGVWYQAKASTGDDIKEQGISQSRIDSTQNRFKINLLYDQYTVQGVYSADAAQLLVYYADGASDRGTLANEPGQVVSPSQYVVGDYVSLVASPNTGYVTRWNVAGTYYYGNVFYYQLNGNPDHNKVIVDFVSESATTSTLSGTLYRAEVELRLGSSSYLPMANTQISITADKTYTATTDANGYFSIPNFTGVNGKTYSVAVRYENAMGYTTFTYQSGTACTLKMPQFAVGVPYPSQVSANVDGTGSGQNMLTLTSGGTLNATVRVYVPPKNYTITGVNFYFLDPSLAEGGAAAQATAFPAACTSTSTSTSGGYQEWTVSVGADQLTSGTRIYVSVEAEKTFYSNGVADTTPISSGLVNGGYALTTPNVDDTVSVLYDVPETPGMQNAESVTLSKLNIPVIGNLDFSVSSKTGAFFVQRTDESGNTTLLCGHTYLSSFGTGTVSEKYEAKKKTQAAIAEKKTSTSLSDRPVGGATPSVAAATPGDALSDSASKNNTEKKASNWSFTPAFLFAITLSPGTEDSSQTYVSQYEMALGIDAYYNRSIPYSFYGVPLYIRLTFTSEAYMDLQATFKSDTLTLDNLEDVLYDLCTGDTSVINSVDSFIAAPSMKFGARGGVGYSGFLSVFLEFTADVPFIISLTPMDAAAKLSFSVAAGAELVVFEGKLQASVDTLEISDNPELIEDLYTIESLASASSASAMSLRSGADSDGTQIPDVEEMLDSLSFSPMTRTAGLRRTAADDGTVASNVFKNTRVQLMRLKNDDIMAFFLQDNNELATLNYLTAAYAVSTDNGETWSDVEYVSDNTSSPNTSLQYNINLFQLEDRTLVTWSEANFDQVLENLDDVEINRLTPAQISRFMNAMNLKGRFFNSTTGEPMGEAFTIAENSTVACGAIDAVQNGDMVYVYYQRNVFPTTDDSDGEVTLSDLLNTERTIALARANVNDLDAWTSTTVRATNENGQQYRITDVEPFVHDGVMGEILVLDRDGKLAEWNAYTETWDLSNEDRQLFLRTYDFDEDGEPTPTALMAITSAQDCAQSPEVVSSNDYLHLFWNQNGSVVYISDFVATTNDHEDIQRAAYVLQDGDGNVTQQDILEYNAYDIASSETFHVGTTFTASMDDGGNVLLCWVGSDTEDTSLLPTDEIYGVILNTITNVQAADRSGGEVSGGNENLYQLYAVGAPVALTDENGLVGALDSLCLESSEDSKFLLAFTKLNSDMQTEVTAADVKAVQSVNVPDLEIESVSAPKYPMPGSEMTVYVTVTNNGLEPAENVSVTSSGVGSASATVETLMPGCTTIVELTVAVPANFAQSATLSVEASAGNSSETASGSAEILYGPYFVLNEMSSMTSVASTKDCWTETSVYNAGNAPGVPTLTFVNELFAVNDDGKTYTVTAEEELAPGGTMLITHLLEDTLINEEQTANLNVSVGDGVDQKVQGRMPKPLALLQTGLPDDSDDPVVPDDPDSDGDGGSSSSSSSSSSSTSTPIVSTGDKTEGGTTTTVTTATPSATTKGDTATSAITSAVGNQIVEQAKENGSTEVVIAPVVTGDVTRTEVSIPASTVGDIGSETEADLTISTPVADVTIPNGGLSDLASAGGTVTVTAEKVGNRVTLEVTAGGETVSEVTGGITLTVPHDDCNPGTVAMLVYEDGTREVVRKSVADDGTLTVTIPLTGSATVELVDNSKAFDDVPDNVWYKDAVDFVSARGLFNGISATEFGGDAPMTRGMLAVVLHRLENELEHSYTGSFGDVPEGSWYGEAILWLAEKGIVTGYGNGDFGAEDEITREQLATMLWRYAGSPAPTGSRLNFTDAGEVSDWAVEAMIWAEENGIMQGYNNAVDPKGNATRAHVAQMLKNFMENALK